MDTDFLPHLPKPPPKSALFKCTVALGVLQCALAITAMILAPGVVDKIPQKVGYVIGTTLFWPAVIVAITALFKSARTARARQITLLVVWGFLALADLSAIAREFGRRGSQQKTATAPSSIAPRPQLPESFYRPSYGVSQKTAAQAPLQALHVAAPPALDFSAGSHERLIKQIEHSQEASYHDIVAAYAKACREQPGDARLALERVRFIDHFLGSEDLSIESAETDHSQARAELMQRFAQAPGTILYDLENSYGEDFERKADDYQPQTASWNRSELAKFQLLRAERTHDKKATLTLKYAEKSFENAPGTEAGLLYAQSLVDLGRKPEALKVLHHEAFSKALAWQKVQRMELLFQLGDRDAAVDLFKELEQSEPQLINTAEIAERLGEAGCVELGRTVLKRVPRREWSRMNLDESLFHFELKHGTPQSAQEAYRAYRDNGYAADPFLRERVRLLVVNPFGAWAWGDLAGLAGFLLTLGLFAAAPLALYVPVHYWSLLRQRAGRNSTWDLSPWGLRQASLLSAGLLVSVFLSIWIWNPQALTEGFRFARNRTPSGASILASQVLLWSISSTLLLFWVCRAKNWRILGPGTWSWGKAFGIALGSIIGLRFCLGIYVVALPLKELLAQVAPLTNSLMLEQLRVLGPFGLLALSGLFVPVLEELLFRGVILGAMARHIPFWAANIAQSLCFAALHEELKLAPFFIGLSLINGLLFQRSKGLFAPIAVHMLNNILVCSLLIAGKTG